MNVVDFLGDSLIILTIPPFPFFLPTFQIQRATKSSRRGSRRDTVAKLKSERNIHCAENINSSEGGTQQMTTASHLEMPPSW